ncbi:CHASE3 domain-containing protein [Siccirubricoccus deserti]
MPIDKALFSRLTLLLIGIGFAALLAAGAGLVWQVETTRNYASAVSSAQEVRVTTLRALSLLQDAEIGQRGFLLTGEESYLAPYHAAVEALPQAMARLAKLVLEDGGRPGPIAELRELATAKLAELARTIALQRAGSATRRSPSRARPMAGPAWTRCGRWSPAWRPAAPCGLRPAPPDLRRMAAPC